MENRTQQSSHKTNKEIDEALRQTAASQLPDMVIIVALLEHQVDLVSKLNRILLDVVDKEKLPEGTQDLVEHLDNFLEYSSVNFEQFKHNPLEAYKFPEAVQNKARTRVVQNRYLDSKINAGLIVVP